MVTRPLIFNLNYQFIKIVPDSIIYADQTGQEYEEDSIDKIFVKIENMIDNLEDLIENELEDNSDKSYGNF